MVAIPQGFTQRRKKELFVFIADILIPMRYGSTHDTGTVPQIERFAEINDIAAGRDHFAHPSCARTMYSSNHNRCIVGGDIQARPISQTQIIPNLGPEMGH